MGMTAAGFTHISAAAADGCHTALGLLCPTGRQRFVWYQLNSMCACKHKLVRPCSSITELQGILQ
jgi:hypothetical protein